jgi:glucose-1-phosphate adenylyltransferase
MPPAKFVFAEDGRTGRAMDSMVSAGVVVSGADGPTVGPLPGRLRAHRYATIEGSVLMHNVDVGRPGGRPQRHHRQERRRIPPDARIGVDPSTTGPASRSPNAGSS